MIQLMNLYTRFWATNSMACSIACYCTSHKHNLQLVQALDILYILLHYHAFSGVLTYDLFVLLQRCIGLKGAHQAKCPYIGETHTQ